jgi:hypothetical protein
MSHPTAGAISAAIADMRAESQLWTRQRDRLAQLAGQVATMILEPQQGTAADFAVAYGDAVATFASRCHQGATETAFIAARLEDVADLYEAEEAENLHRINDLY